MGEDTTGYQAAIEAIPEGQLSSRQQRIATGLAMIREGTSCNAAAKACGIPQKTLWRYQHNLVELTSETDIRAAEADLLRGSITIARMAQERIQARLADDDNPMKDGDLVKAYGVGTDKVSIQRGWQRGTRSADDHTRDALGSILDQMRAGDEITYRKADEAIDVTPEGQPDEG